MNLISPHASARRLAFLLACINLSLGNWAVAQSVVNPGFNDNSGWTLANDATLAHPGGEAPWSWDTPVVATTFVNSAEDVLPPEGSGMGITYAGSDSFTQSVLFPSSGLYTFSVDANAISGTAVQGLPTVDGLFAFFAGGSSSPDNLVTTASGWNSYQWTTFVSAGAQNVGLRNTLSAVYAVAYDNFAIIPEPSTSGLLVLAFAVAGLRRVGYGFYHTDDSTATVSTTVSRIASN